jgi:hypothetical protein
MKEHICGIFEKETVFFIYLNPASVEFAAAARRRA